MPLYNKEKKYFFSKEKAEALYKTGEYTETKQVWGEGGFKTVKRTDNHYSLREIEIED